MTTHYLIMTADITPPRVGEITAYLTDLKIGGATELYLAVNSPGGTVVSGIAIHNLLIAMPYKIITHNIANVDSIANVIYLAGEERYANANSTFMFHGVGFDAVQERLEEKGLLEKLDTIQAEHRRISTIISAKSGLSLDACLALFKEQKTRDASWAKSNGMVTGIKDFTLPATANVRYLA